MEDKYLVTWRNSLIGTYHITGNDMWYYDGTWTGDGSPASVAFESLASSFDAATVMKDPTKGTRLTLRATGSGHIIHMLVLSLKEKILFTRIAGNAEAVSWLIDNVQ